MKPVSRFFFLEIRNDVGVDTQLYSGFTSISIAFNTEGKKNCLNKLGFKFVIHHSEKF